MRKVALIASCVFGASALSLVSADAMPIGTAPDAAPQTVLVADGCGYRFHLNPYGYCVPNAWYGGAPVVGFYGGGWGGGGWCGGHFHGGGRHR